MPRSNEKLASALEQLRRLQTHGRRVFESSELARTARERLLKHGFLQEVMRGWLMSASPATLPGDTTPWFASFWEFCARYCAARFGPEWHVSPEQSLLLHAENTAVPKQVVIHSPHAGNNRIDLPFGTSFFALRIAHMPPAGDIENLRGLRVFRIEPALVRVGEAFFERHPVEARVAIGAIREPSRLLQRLLDGGHATIGGRLAGAFRTLGKPAIADEIVAVMRAADHDVRETDPLAARAVTTRVGHRSNAPPIVARLERCGQRRAPSRAPSSRA